MLTAQVGNSPASGDDLRSAVIFFASFDETVKADIAGGQATLNTRSNHPTEPGRFVFDSGFNEQVFRISKDKGISGGALEVVDVLPNNGRIYFPAQGNLPFDPKGWNGALSVWCKTDPNQLLKTTFCDPIQITEKGANNGGLWFDFNNAKPRDMRHGAFPAVPTKEKPIAEDDPKAPIVLVPKIDWKADAWHHVVLTWSGFDTGKSDAVSQIYIDSKLIGAIRDCPIAMQWDLEKTGIYVAVNYIGLLDELAIFRRALSANEVLRLYREPAFLK
ncbi:hypothetical protein ETAA8_21370 [Anatilimnocola aggregata]|uniref:LamG domain-containing protein n=1 Tax=Anatilimnocola aggregata TaxID=2528021 RepID=A0A517Y9Y6_9BACT|nr:LamG domain-containing protein [Anatilimnocola aggregata]QDU27053.1 hypothetical protein ETAA8_21370 [Anatilimnocola aggregata]